MLSEMEKNKKLLTETLMKGRDSAKKLQSLRRRKLNFDGSVSVEDLLVEIMGSFTGGLSMLNSCDSGDVFGVPAYSSGDQMPEVYSGKKPAPAMKERRGCYKRRRTIDSRVEISSTFQDEYAWRKYGQKEILNSKFPRCYYRCTHKHVYGCKALKQVQQLEDESNKFHITYFGNHTCPSPNNFSHHGVVLNFNKDSKNLHYFPVFGGGKPADVFLWRNKKISASVLGGATAMWVLFELLEYHLLTLVCHVLIFVFAVLFLWSNASKLINKSPPRIPEVKIPEDTILQAAGAIRNEINYSFAVLKDIASGKDLKKFLAVVAGLWVLSIVGSCCSFLTLFYITFVLLHTVPVLYEKYEDEVDAFAGKAMIEFKKQYAVFDDKVLSKIPKGPLKNKKNA